MPPQKCALGGIAVGAGSKAHLALMNRLVIAFLAGLAACAAARRDSHHVATAGLSEHGIGARHCRVVACVASVGNKEYIFVKDAMWISTNRVWVKFAQWWCVSDARVVLAETLFIFGDVRSCKNEKSNPTRQSTQWREIYDKSKIRPAKRRVRLQ
jgi:hypothetical protein